MGNANLESSLQPSLLSDCAPSSDQLTNSNISREALNLVSYESLASMLIQCETPKENKHASLNSHSAHSQEELLLLKFKLKILLQPWMQGP